MKDISVNRILAAIFETDAKHGLVQYMIDNHTEDEGPLEETAGNVLGWLWHALDWQTVLAKHNPVDSEQVMFVAMLRGLIAMLEERGERSSWGPHSPAAGDVVDIIHPGLNGVVTVDCGPLQVEVKITDEGVIADIFDGTDEDTMGTLASTYAFFSECSAPEELAPKR